MIIPFGILEFGILEYRSIENLDLKFDGPWNYFEAMISNGKRDIFEFYLILFIWLSNELRPDACNLKIYQIYFLM